MSSDATDPATGKIVYERWVEGPAVSATVAGQRTGDRGRRAVKIVATKAYGSIA
jgi:hypothetical protein